MASCGPPRVDDDDDRSSQTLAIEPASAELVVRNGVSASQPFRATLTDRNGNTRDVTDDVTFSVDGSNGSILDNIFTVNLAGRTAVVARLDDLSAKAAITVRLESVRIDPSLPPTIGDLFDGPESPSRAPTVVYPAADVAVPRNLGDFDIHWTDGAGNDAFEISVKTELTDVRIYVRGGNGLPAAGPMASWARLTPTEWIGAIGGENRIGYQVRGVSLSDPTSVGSAPERFATLTDEAMEGGVYYWATYRTVVGQTPVQGVFRHDMSQPGEPAEEYFTTKQSNNRCVGCHSLSRDGKRMALTFDGGDNTANVLDVASKALQTEQYRWNFATFTRDGSQLLTVSDGVISVRDANDQSVLGQADGAAATHIDLSPDGSTLVYVRPPSNSLDWRFDDGDIYTRSYDQATRSFGPEQPLVVSSGNDYYPSWSPDGEWIVFNRSSGSSYDATDASVWIIKADRSQPPIQLITANSGIGLTNSWARWAPFAQTTGSGEPMFWITMSSKRDFGVRMINSGSASKDQVPQIWMWAFYPQRAATGDPCTPPFHLPFQNLATRNHIAQWTERIVILQ